MTKRILIYFPILLCGVIVSCSKQNEQALTTPVNGTPGCDTINMKLATNVVPILSSNCYSCHGNGRAFGGVKLDVYTELKVWATSGSLVGTISHSAGYSPMPQNAAKLSDCDINKIKDWVNRGSLNN